MPINILLKCHDVETTKSFHEEKLELDFDVIEAGQEACTLRKEDYSLIFTSQDLSLTEILCFNAHTLSKRYA